MLCDIELYGAILTCEFEYTPYEPATYSDPPEGGYIEIHSVTVSQDMDIASLLSEVPDGESLREDLENRLIEKMGMLEGAPYE